MSKTKSALAATLLTLVFAFPTLGGNIGSPGGTPPPPPPPSTDGGNIGSSGSQVPPEDLNSDVLSSAVIVDILIAVLSLF